MKHILNDCNTGKSDLLDMYAYPRTRARDEQYYKY